MHKIFPIFFSILIIGYVLSLSEDSVSQPHVSRIIIPDSGGKKADTSTRPKELQNMPSPIPVRRFDSLVGPIGIWVGSIELGQLDTSGVAPWEHIPWEQIDTLTVGDRSLMEDSAFVFKDWGCYKWYGKLGVRPDDPDTIWLVDTCGSAGLITINERNDTLTGLIPVIGKYGIIVGEIDRNDTLFIAGHYLVGVNLKDLARGNVTVSKGDPDYWARYGSDTLAPYNQHTGKLLFLDTNFVTITFSPYDTVAGNQLLTNRFIIGLDTVDLKAWLDTTISGGTTSSIGARDSTWIGLWNIGWQYSAELPPSSSGSYKFRKFGLNPVTATGIAIDLEPGLGDTAIVFTFRIIPDSIKQFFKDSVNLSVHGVSPILVDSSGLNYQISIDLDSAIAYRYNRNVYVSGGNVTIDSTTPGLYVLSYTEADPLWAADTSNNIRNEASGVRGTQIIASKLTLRDDLILETVTAGSSDTLLILEPSTGIVKKVAMAWAYAHMFTGYSTFTGASAGDTTGGKLVLISRGSPTVREYLLPHTTNDYYYGFSAHLQVRAGNSPYVADYVASFTTIGYAGYGNLVDGDKIVLRFFPQSGVNDRRLRIYRIPKDKAPNINSTASYITYGELMGHIALSSSLFPTANWYTITVTLNFRTGN